MNCNEFNRRFDIEYNNITSNAAPGLTLEEKSVFLTKAEETICMGIYTGVIGGYPFEADESARRALSNLTKTVVNTAPVSSSDLLGLGIILLGSDSKVYTLPSDVWYITYEEAVLSDVKPGCLGEYTASVIPVTQDEYYKIHDNPFRGPSRDRVLRLDLGEYTLSGNKKLYMELSSKYTIKTYLTRYMRRPLPIILENLADSSIWGISLKTECELPESLHSLILQEAVKEAKITYETGLNASVSGNG